MPHTRTVSRRSPAIDRAIVIGTARIIRDRLAFARSSRRAHIFPWVQFAWALPGRMVKFRNFRRGTPRQLPFREIRPVSLVKACAHGATPSLLLIVRAASFAV